MRGVAEVLNVVAYVTIPMFGVALSFYALIAVGPMPTQKAICAVVLHTGAWLNILVAYLHEYASRHYGEG
jgi:hypothetical protein